MNWNNPIAGTAASGTSRFIEKPQVILRFRSGLIRILGRYA
jgi:hypothetical protein